MIVSLYFAVMMKKLTEYVSAATATQWRWKTRFAFTKCVLTHQRLK